MDDLTPTPDAPDAEPDAPAPASTPSRPSLKANDDESPSGPRVIFEQVLIALVLAFVFRAFVVEAFIIPTGSMATTLLGAHTRYDCPDCGWNFTVNYSQSSSGTLVPTRALTANGQQERIFNTRCPNCAFRLPPAPLEGLDPDSEDSAGPPIYYGDRILVLKYLYLLRDPERYDVVVFKNPSRASRNYDNLRPEQYAEPFQENYIKRLVGLPGEALMLLDGDLYVADEVRHKENREIVPEDFRIARKGEVAQSALWRVVYDDDFRPWGADRSFIPPGFRHTRDAAFEMPWRAGSQWREVALDEGGGFAFDGGEGRLRFDADAVPMAHWLTDYLGYDQTWNDPNDSVGNTLANTYGPGYEFGGKIGSRRTRSPYLHRADDLKLSLVHDRIDGEGPIVLTLEGNGHAFAARVTPGLVQLEHTAPGGEPTVVAEYEEDGLSDVGDLTQLEIEHADYAVTVRVGGEPVLHFEYDPDVAALIDAEVAGDSGPLPGAAVTAANHVASVRHLKLYRDVYYTARDQTGGGMSPGSFYNFASPDDFPDHVVRLGDDEYFVVGDNPMLSGDARTWDARRDAVELPTEDLSVEGGRVPGRFLLGKAFFVYWPGGYRPLPKTPPIVPNFGEMRLIR